MQAITEPGPRGAPNPSASIGELVRGFPRSLWALVLSPRRFFAQVPAEEGVGYLNAMLFSLLCFLVPFLIGLVLAMGIGAPILLILALITGEASNIAPSMAGLLAQGLLLIILVPVLGLILIPISLFIGTCIQHPFVCLFARPSRRGFGETFKLLAYAGGPPLLVNLFVSWIPFVGLFVSFLTCLWQMALAVIGVGEVHRTTWARAALAIVVPNAILTTLIIVLFS